MTLLLVVLGELACCCVRAAACDAAIARIRLLLIRRAVKIGAFCRGK